MKRFEGPRDNQESEPPAKRQKVTDINRLQVEEGKKPQAPERSAEQQKIDQQIAKMMEKFDQQAERAISEYQLQNLDNKILSLAKYSASRGHYNLEAYQNPLKIVDNYQGREASGQTQNYSREQALNALTKVRNFLNDKNKNNLGSSQTKLFNHLKALERQYQKSKYEGSE